MFIKIKSILFIFDVTEVSWIQKMRSVQMLSLRKKNCKFNSKICICQSGSSSASSAKLLLFTEVMWKMFLNAAVEQVMRGFQTLPDNLKVHTIKKLMQSIYTSKPHTERIRKSAAVAATSAAEAV